MNNNEDLRRRVAWLESKVDQLETELVHLNDLLIDCGFAEGVSTLKATISELLEEAGERKPFNTDEDYPPTQTFNPFA